MSRAHCTGRAWLASSSRTSRFISGAPTHYRLSCRLKFGDISIKGTAKEQQTKLQRQQFARRRAEAAIAVAEIEAARFAKIAISALLAPYSTSSSDGRPPGSGLTRRAVLSCPRRLLQPLPVRLMLTRSAPVCHSSRCRRPYQSASIAASHTLPATRKGDVRHSLLVLPPFRRNRHPYLGIIVMFIAKDPPHEK